MLLCLSVDHRTADLDMLERIERRAETVTAALSENTARGVVVLSTCNRFEAYVDAPDHGPGPALEAVARAAQLTPAELADTFAVHHGDAAAEHLFAVSSGLESAAVGEGEIAGQVRRAWESARTAGRTSTDLEQLFQHAMAVSKEVKNRTGLQTRGRSLVQLALTLVDTRVTDWSTARVVLIGTGAYAGASLAALRVRGVDDIGVFSPSGRAEVFAASHDLRPIPAGDLAAELSRADVVVACSSTSEPVLTREHLGGTTRPRVLIDMGLPRNISPDVGEEAGIELLDLETIALHAPIPELGAELEARDIVRTAAAEFAALRAERDVVPALRDMRAFVTEVMEDEIARLRGRSADSADEIEAALRHAFGRLMHRPTVRLRQLARAGAAGEAAAAVTALFSPDSP
ncbi:glutamyl-tRNA reductase [Microbacterium nymphoidis]|uniref:glutamyl-tRNA reductase n=1 Tax=Microbacterium nymphoidis TaxID=2898586 RepID=UPI0022AA9C1E|nr:glutamyl-tRNA reductase [Microbacterium nymphoidis]